MIDSLEIETTCQLIYQRNWERESWEELGAELISVCRTIYASKYTVENNRAISRPVVSGESEKLAAAEKYTAFDTEMEVT